jgi:hypothetical protein
MRVVPRRGLRGDLASAGLSQIALAIRSTSLVRERRFLFRVRGRFLHRTLRHAQTST